MAQAETLAQRSWTLGPCGGALCARNQQTVLEIASDAAGVAQARTVLAACRVRGHAADVSGWRPRRRPAGAAPVFALRAQRCRKPNW